jgi:hypothetical protein
MSATRFAGALTAVLSAAALFAAPGDAAAARGGLGVISRNGRVGKVHVGRSTVGQVLAWAGRPTLTSDQPGENGAPAHELRYGCGHGRATSYTFDGHGRLANFITTCHRFRTADGTRVGDSQVRAERLEGKNAEAGCGGGKAIFRQGGAFLYVSFFTVGGDVRALAVAGRNSVLGC